MSTNPSTLDAKDPEEIIPVSFEFAALAAEPTSPVVSIARHSGTADTSDLTAMLVGAPQIIGTQVRQKVTGGVNGTYYRLRCRVDTPEGYRWAEAALLPVQTA